MHYKPSKWYRLWTYDSDPILVATSLIESLEQFSECLEVRCISEYIFLKSFSSLNADFIAAIQSCPGVGGFVDHQINSDQFSLLYLTPRYSPFYCNGPVLVSNGLLKGKIGRVIALAYSTCTVALPYAGAVLSLSFKYQELTALVPRKL